MSRNIITDEATALAEIAGGATMPAWLEGATTLPFSALSPDEFEVFCFLLLRREQPDDEVLYYGKTGDAGRDIVVRPHGGGSQRFFQCKRYAGSLGVGEVREELAKLVCNIQSGVLPESPSDLTFLASSDFTSPAQDLLDDQQKWIAAAPAALEEHLHKKPDAAVLSLASSWWPRFRRVNGHELTERALKFAPLVERFFALKKVVEGNLAVDVTPFLKKLSDQVDRVQMTLEVRSQPASAEIANLLQRLENDNTGLSFSWSITAGGPPIFNVAPKVGASVEVGRLTFPEGEQGQRGRAKFDRLVDFGEAVRLEEGEFGWNSSLKGVPHIETWKTAVLELVPRLPPDFAVTIVCGDPNGAPDIAYARAKVLALGRRRMVLELWGGELAGRLKLTVGLGGETDHRVSYSNDLPSAPARAARATLEFMVRVARQDVVTVRSCDFGTALVSFQPGPELLPEVAMFERSVLVAKQLEVVASRFDVDVRYPDQLTDHWLMGVRMAHAAVEAGRVVFAVPGGVICDLVPLANAQRLLEVWEEHCPASVVGALPVPVEIGGVAIPLGEVRVIWESAAPVDGIEALRATLASSEGPFIQLAVAVDHVLYEFPDFLKGEG